MEQSGGIVQLVCQYRALSESNAASLKQLFMFFIELLVLDFRN